MRAELLSTARCSGGEAAHPMVRTYADFQAWIRSGCFVDPQNDLPRFRFYTVGQFLEWAYARHWSVEHVERILAAVGTVRGRVGGGEQDQGAFNAQTFSSTLGATFTLPDNVGFMVISGYGAGGGGGSGGSNASAGGGGAGGASLAGVQVVTTSGNATVTVGTGGTGGNAVTGGLGTGNAGGAGGDTTWGALATFGGASGGGQGNTGAGVNAGGGQCVKGRAGANLLTIATAAAIVITPMLASGGLGGGSGVVGLSGNRNVTGGFESGAGSASATAGGGGGGGAGVGGAGGAGGAGVASGAPNAGGTAGANTGAGGGGGGGQATNTSPSGAGGVGGSGSVTGVW